MTEHLQSKQNSQKKITASSTYMWEQWVNHHCRVDSSLLFMVKTSLFVCGWLHVGY